MESLAECSYLDLCLKAPFGIHVSEMFILSREILQGFLSALLKVLV